MSKKDSETMDNEGHLTIKDILSQGQLGVLPEEDDEPDPSDEDEVDADEELDEEDDELDEDEEEEEEEEEKFQYKSHAEAEKAVRAAKKKMHDATRDLKDLQKRTLASAGKVEPEVKIDPLEEISKITAKELAALDKKAEDYNEKVVKVLAKQSEMIADVKRNQEKQAEQFQQRIVDHITMRLKEADMEEYFYEFWALAPAVPNHITDLDDAIQWGINAVKGLIKKATGEDTKSKKKRKKKAKESFSLTKGKKGPGKKKIDEPAKEGDSLGDAMKQMRESMTVK